VIGRRDFLGKLLGTMRHVPVGMDDLEKLGIEHAPAIAGTHMELSVRAEGGVLPAAQVDGEEIPAGDRYVIDVAARALRLIVPREHIDTLGGAEESGVVPMPSE